MRSRGRVVYWCRRWYPNRTSSERCEGGFVKVKDSVFARVLLLMCSLVLIAVSSLALFVIAEDFADEASRASQVPLGERLVTRATDLLP